MPHHLIGKASEGFEYDLDYGLRLSGDKRKAAFKNERKYDNRGYHVEREGRVDREAEGRQYYSVHDFPIPSLNAMAAVVMVIRNINVKPVRTAHAPDENFHMAAASVMVEIKNLA